MKLFNEKIISSVKEADIDLEDITLDLELALEEFDALVASDDTKELALENLNSIKECLTKTQSLDTVIALI